MSNSPGGINTNFMPSEFVCTTGTFRYLDHSNCNCFAFFSSNGAIAGGWTRAAVGRSVAGRDLPAQLRHLRQSLFDLDPGQTSASFGSACRYQKPARSRSRLRSSPCLVSAASHQASPIAACCSAELAWRRFHERHVLQRLVTAQRQHGDAPSPIALHKALIPPGRQVGGWLARDHLASKPTPLCTPGRHVVASGSRRSWPPTP